MPVDIEVGELDRVGDRLGQRSEWPGVRDPLMGPVKAIEPLVLLKYVALAGRVGHARSYGAM